MNLLFYGHLSHFRLKAVSAVLSLMLTACMSFCSVAALAQPNSQSGPGVDINATAVSSGFKELKAERPEQQPIFAALNQRQHQTLASYELNRKQVQQDPFLPAKAFRGPTGDTDIVDDCGENGQICGPALSQLTLVAITISSDGSGALASFEDGAGHSYMYRAGDIIGRKKGHIVSITSSMVIVEEPGGGGAKSAKITEIKMRAPDMSTSLTRAGAGTQVL